MASIDGTRLIDAAVATTELGDFGDPSWREGYDRLVASLAAEAALNAVGEHAFVARLSAYLEQRLRVVDWRRRHPSIAAEQIGGPLIITGLPRTGTTALSNLLARDAATRSLRVWESGAPTPPPQAATYDSDPRIAAAQRGIDLMGQFAPDLKKMHDDDATSTAEAIDLLGMSFRTQHFGGMARVPSYDRWLLDADMAPAYRFHRETLQLLQWRCPPTRWHLKNPPDVFHLGAVCATYPDAVFVWTHRDPAAVLPSVCSLIATIRAMTSDAGDPRALGAEMLDLWQIGIERALAFRAAHPHVRFVDVFMRDLVREPLATVAALYEQIGWPLTAEAEAAFAAWIAANPPARHGDHRPDPGLYGLAATEIRARFQSYLQRFDLPAS